MSYVTVSGLTLHYTLGGADTGQPLVFANSLGTDLRVWDEVVPSFAGRFRLIRYDKRGHGLSDAPPGPYSIRDHTRDLAGLLAHLGVDRAIFVGISVGGQIVMDYALLHPERITALVLCDTAPKIGAPELWRDRIQAVREQGLGPLAATLMGRWFAPQFASQRPADYRGYANMLARTPQEGYLGTCAALRDADLREQVKAITAPALVLCGSEDISTPPGLVSALAQALPRARFEVIEGAAHLACVERPQAVAAAIHRFCQDNGYGG